VIRKLERADKPRLEEWAGRDPEIFYTREAVVVENDGVPVLYAMFTKVRRVDIQFEPGGSPLKTARALKELDKHFATLDCEEVIFDSTAPKIVDFVVGRGWTKEPATLSKKRGNHVLGK
jgi:hypothetical protein